VEAGLESWPRARVATGPGRQVSRLLGLGHADRRRLGDGFLHRQL